MKQSSWMTAGVLGAALLALLGYSVWHNTDLGSGPIAKCEQDSGKCDKNLGAILNLSEPIVVNKALMLKLTLPESMAQGDFWQGRLEGRDMYMGITPVTLKAADRSNQYQGQLRIPICTTEQMAWRLILESSDGSKSILMYEFMMSQP